MSSAQALSSLVTLAVSFSRIVFPRSVCAETEPTDKMASKGNNPSLASDFTVNFIRTSSDDWLRTAQLCRSRRGVAMEPERCFLHYPHWAKESVRLETP